ncbi:MAG: glycosyltransferase family 39 protein [Anaerolineae bacterium]|nr:glycosyltransferase family 39 protein [Anaerolineae bacterium]
MTESSSPPLDSLIPRSLISNIQYPTLVILLFAFALRLFRLGAESLWYDETVSVTLAGQDVAGLVAHTARDIHPPGYYLLLHFWQALAGQSDFTAAFLSLFFGMLLVALAYRLAGRLFGRRAATIAALFVAISPYNVWYSQEVRMYTLGAVLAMGVVCAALRYRQAPTATGGKGEVAALVTYAVCGALGMWTLYYFAFLLVAVNLCVVGGWLAGWRRASMRWSGLGGWALAQVAVIILYAPWLPVAWRQATDPPVPPWRSFTGAWDVLVQTYTALGLGQSAELAWGWPALVVLAALLVLALVGRGAARVSGARPVGRTTAAWFLIGCVFVPVALIYLASFVTPLFHVRYVFTYSTPFYVVVAAGLAWLWRRWMPAGAGALALVALLASVSLVAYHASPRYAADDHRAAVAFLAEEWRPGDAIVVNAGYVYPAVLTYWPETGVDKIAWQGRLVGSDVRAVDPCAGPPLFLMGTVDGDPDLGWGDPASDFYAMTRAETEEALEHLFATYHRVWIYRIYDTVADPGGFVRDWLDEHGTPFVDQVFTGESQLRVQGYLTGRDPYAGACPTAQPGSPLAWDGGSLLLTGITWYSTTVEAGGALDLATVWQAGAAPPRDVYLFLGLFDDEGRRWAQVDKLPAGPLYPTEQWAAGELVRIPLRLLVPVSTPPGEYRIELGWYRFEAGQPVWLSSYGGSRFSLGQVDVVPPAAGWKALPAPEPAYSVGVDLGVVRLLGFDTPSLEKQPGSRLDIDLYWQAGEEPAQAAPAVLRLVDGEGNVVEEWASAPAGGRAPFTQWAPGQTVRDPRVIPLSSALEPGIYHLEIGRRTAAGEWLPIHRGPVPLGSVYPLATVPLSGRTPVLVPPLPQHPRTATLGSAIRFLGYDLELESEMGLTLYWQPVEPVTERYKIALHLLGSGGPGDIRAQADVYPHLPTTSWLPGEYLVDRVKLDLPASVEEEGGEYTLWLALYDGATGARLPVYSENGTPLGDGLVLDEVLLGE